VARAVELVDPAPADEILEVGCGPGVAVALLCERLTDGRVTGIDRSATAIARATVRNAPHVASGRAVLRVLPLAELEPVGPPFDAALAVNVNLFWVGPADTEIALLHERLRPGGTLWAVYESPGRDGARRVEPAVRSQLERHGFATATHTEASGVLAISATRAEV
jgi:trans-aconitate methyltransferase